LKKYPCNWNFLLNQSINRSKVMVTLYLWIGSGNSVISFYTFNVSILCILPPWRWSKGWSKQ